MFSSWWNLSIWGMVHTDTWISSSIHLPNKFYLSVVALPFGSGRRQQWSKWKNHLFQDAGKLIQKFIKFSSIFSMVVSMWKRSKCWRLGQASWYCHPSRWYMECHHCWLQSCWWDQLTSLMVQSCWNLLRKIWSNGQLTSSSSAHFFNVKRKLCNYVNVGWNDCLGSFLFLIWLFFFIGVMYLIIVS